MKIIKGGYVYIPASRRNGTLYIGATSNLIQRVWEHKTHAVYGFTAKYCVTQLVWYEQRNTIEGAIYKEMGTCMEATADRES
jgi:putative endonuclease